MVFLSVVPRPPAKPAANAMATAFPAMTGEAIIWLFSCDGLGFRCRAGCPEQVQFALRIYRCCLFCLHDAFLTHLALKALIDKTWANIDRLNERPSP